MYEETDLGQGKPEAKEGEKESGRGDPGEDSRLEEFLLLACLQQLGFILGNQGAKSEDGLLDARELGIGLGGGVRIAEKAAQLPGGGFHLEEALVEPGQILGIQPRVGQEGDIADIFQNTADDDGGLGDGVQGGVGVAQFGGEALLHGAREEAACGAGRVGLLIQFALFLSDRKEPFGGTIEAGLKRGQAVLSNLQGGLDASEEIGSAGGNGLTKEPDGNGGGKAEQEQDGGQEQGKTGKETREESHGVTRWR